jgi:hypothetical protein
MKLPSGASGGAAVILSAFAVGELAIFRRPDLTRNAAFLFGEQGFSLFVANEVLHGARLYRDVAYPYGWLPVAMFVACARMFGNTPVVYLQFLLVTSVAGLACAYAALRRFLPPGPSAFVTIVGLMPVFLLPGSLLGGYTTAFYQPVERLFLVLTVLAWQPPRRRTVSNAAALGAIAVGMQACKFGPGLVLLAVLFALDVALIAIDRQASWAAWARCGTVTVGIAAAGECVLASAAFALLPRPVAADVLWPAYFIGTYPPSAARWPALTNWRLVAAQYANPIAGMVVTAAGLAMLWQRRSGAADDERWGLMVLPALFVAGAFTFFRTDHHFRQFGWMFVFGAAAAIAQWRTSAIVAAIGWVPVACVVALSVIRPPDGERVALVTPNGWRLSIAAVEQTRIDGIVSALGGVGGRGPVLFCPNGTGLFVAYSIPHVSRENWFYRIALRPYEFDTLNREYAAVTALVDCSALENIPDEVREPLERRIAARVWNDDACVVYRLAARSADR